eukprot:TRINITY_DN2922_c0_g2_i1.p1 TRINITY_DN2922_c0_g2~~TRINITY_DN2922_c0_g2_i1.p1  ORF type:complete len:513 (-),score=73.85 TRINITY_DN2922_c0_g2_i1:272-1810(-)
MSAACRALTLILTCQLIANAEVVTSSTMLDALNSDDQCQPGESSHDCSLNALQLRKSSSQTDVQSQTGAQEGCHTMTEEDLKGKSPCADAIRWARTTGFATHPEWYPGMDPKTTPITEWQLKAWNTTHPTCARPCAIKEDTHWCQNQQAPELWKPHEPDNAVQVQILSYNLFWWNLFKIHGGRSAGDLIKRNTEQRPFDVMGFQECENTSLIMDPVGLQSTYRMFLHKAHAICMGYHSGVWDLIAKGEADVADDMRTEYYGKRAVQWMRLQHKQSDLKLFFVNHHGPLSVNSGGECGGKSTAYNIMKVMAKHGGRGDTLVLVGDFNANAASKTIQSFWPHMLHVYNSPSFGGVDNVFSNADRSQVKSKRDLGSGGSDHHAIEVVLEIGGPQGKQFNEGSLEIVHQSRNEVSEAIDTAKRAGGADGCLIEPNVEYTIEPSWTQVQDGVTDPKVCCMRCNGHRGCKSWVWKDWPGQCVLHGGSRTGSQEKKGFASGLPNWQAVKHAQETGARLS